MTNKQRRERDGDVTRQIARLSDEEAAHRARHQLARAALGDGEHRFLLVTDDTERAQFACTALLASKKFDSFTVVPSVDKAADELASGHFDLLVVERTMVDECRSYINGFGTPVLPFEALPGLLANE